MAAISSKFVKAPSFIFIPDISGFSEFVNDTEIEHSRHIISELLNLIIKSNKLGMEVIEVEGDAILFYKKNVPRFDDILDQAKKMFIEFHHHLRKYETLRICQCGACSSASSLSLKFIAHSGEVVTVDVGNLQKLHGKEVVIAHKLLKNSVPDHEYLLATDRVMENSTISEDSKKWAEVISGNDVYNKSLHVNYGYVLLQKLHAKVPPVEHLDLPQKTENPFRYSVEIDAPVNLVQSYMTDLSLKKLWFKGLKGVEYDSNRVNRVGTVHTCIVGGRNHLKFKSITNHFGAGKWVYGEKLLNPKFARDMEFYFIADRLETARTMLVFELHVKLFPGPLAFISNIFKKRMSKVFKTNIENFKLICEVEVKQ
jgi:hypothetical protein